MNKEHKEESSLSDREPKLESKVNSLNKKRLILPKNEFIFSSISKLLVGFVQVILGVAIVTLSSVELIQPIWLAIPLSILGCISVFTGIMLAYSSFSYSLNYDSLINKAIKRVITFQN